MIVSAQQAAELIQAGQVVALPTETVYGLAADASNILAVEKIFELKQRPADNPLIVHLADAEQISTFSDFHSDELSRLIERFWPGPLTLILPKKSNVLDIITAGLDTVALRMPNHPSTLSVIRLSGPLAAPSANRSGRPSPTRPEHVIDDFGSDLPVVDGGSCTIGLESTVLDISGEDPAILRPGKITAEEISTYESLANENIKGRLLIRSSANIYNQSLLASIIAQEGEDAAKTWAKGLLDNLARKPQGGDTDQIKALAAGVCDIALANSYYFFRLQRSDNPDDLKVVENLGVVFPGQNSTGTHVNISGAGVLKHAKNKAAAITFLEYLTSDAAQAYFANGNNEYPVVQNVQVNPIVEAQKDFKAQDINVREFGVHQTKAKMIFDEIAFP
jgi:tRNA threonylcarbamoyl adenosine modification protein (Sua5/YciO/YrdC/YwlC family)